MLWTTNSYSEMRSAKVMVEGNIFPLMRLDKRRVFMSQILAAWAAWMSYWLQSRTYISSDFFMANIPSYLLWMFYSTSNIRIGRSLCGWYLLGYLCIIGIGSWGYLSGEYTENQGKLNLRQLISARSGSNASVLTMAGVLSEGSQYTDYLTLYTLFI